jgi:DDE superfamily endonuclease
MDTGIIGSLKKIYNHICLKEIIAFHDFPEAMKQERIEAGAAGVLYKPPTLLDAAHYIQEAWSVIKMDTIINCFVSADFIDSLA